MHAIKAVYFDGLTSKPNSVIVRFTQSTIQINSIDNPIQISTIWDIEKVKNIDFSSGNNIQLQYGNDTIQTLVINGKNEFDTIKKYFPQIIYQNFYNRVLKGNNIKVVTYSLITLLSIIFLYFTVVAPYISTKVVELITVEQEISLGNKMYESLEPYLDVNKEKSGELNRFFSTLHFKSKYPVEIIYSDSDEINAFAVPGGKIVIHKGLINQLESWEQLAALISHELAHVSERHSLKLLSKNLSSYFIIAIITSDFSGISGVYIDNAFKLKNLSNSRSFEQQADEIGLKYMVNSKINPNGMIELFNILQNKEYITTNNKNIKKIIKIISTHPLTGDRIDNIKLKIKQLTNTVYEKNEEAKQLFIQLKN